MEPAPDNIWGYICSVITELALTRLQLNGFINVYCCQGLAGVIRCLQLLLELRQNCRHHEEFNLFTKAFLQTSMDSLALLSDTSLDAFESLKKTLIDEETYDFWDRI